MRSRFFTVFLLLFTGSSFLFAQKIRLINTTQGDVSLKIQNEVTFEFDRLTLSAGSTVELESASSRRVNIADSIHYYAINEIVDGVEQVTVFQLKAKASDIRKSGIYDEWDEEDCEEADIIILSENNELSEENEVILQPETEAEADTEAETEVENESGIAEETETETETAVETVESENQVLKEKLRQTEEKLSNMEERLLRLEQQLGL